MPHQRRRRDAHRRSPLPHNDANPQPSEQSTNAYQNLRCVLFLDSQSSEGGAAAEGVWDDLAASAEEMESPAIFAIVSPPSCRRMKGRMS